VNRIVKIARTLWVAAALVFLFTAAAQAQAPSITPSGIVNSASLRSSTAPALAPGSLVSIFGTNLSSVTQTAIGPPYRTKSRQTRPWDEMLGLYFGVIVGRDVDVHTMLSMRQFPDALQD
jgi:hypothetical protein